MEIPIKVCGQTMEIKSCHSVIADNSQKFVKFRFELNEDWKSLKVFAQFTQNNKSYNAYLDINNCVYLPSEIKGGICYLMIYGTGANNVIGSTNRIGLTITPNGFVGDANSTEISESLYEQLLDEIRKFSFVSFEIDAKTGMLKMNSTDGFNGANFKINANGELEVEI